VPAAYGSSRSSGLEHGPGPRFRMGMLRVWIWDVSQHAAA